MNEPSAPPPKRRYRWPWVVLAAFLFWVLLAIAWMCGAVRQVEQQRDFSAPPPAKSNH